MKKNTNAKTIWQVWICGAARPLAERNDANNAFNIARAWQAKYPQMTTYLVEKTR